jgi:hypothetical protein
MPKALHDDPVRGAEQHDAADAARAGAGEPGIGRRRHRATVFVAGMRRDQQLRWPPRSGVAIGGDRGEIARDLRLQRRRRGAVEQVVDDRMAYPRHGQISWR